jgi:hypothetical protein
MTWFGFPTGNIGARAGVCPSTLPARLMIHRYFSRHVRLFRALLVLLLQIAPVRASYFSLTRDTKDAQQCITYDARYPYWTDHIYIATYPGHSRSKEGWIAPYYGGIVSNTGGGPTLIQYASWQMGGKDAPASGIDFVHAGPHMSWARSTWEGSSGGIKGLWPQDEFKPKEWYRFVNRVWTPVAGTPHLGYAGVWMKSIATNEWFHLATFKFPAELTGFNSMGGFCEYVTGGATKTCAVEFRNVYAMRNGKWGSEAEFSAFNHKEDIIRIAQPADKTSVLLETTRSAQDAEGKYAVLPVVTQKVELKQPTEPDFFDPVGVSSPSAEGYGKRCVVRWSVPAKASPQLGYSVKIRDGSKIIASAIENDPEARECVLEVGAATGRPVVRMHVTDIFGRDSQPVTFPISRAAPLAAKPARRVAPGLNYRYFESAKPDEWHAIPEMSKLSPKREGVVATPDLTPRLSRTGYAFDFSGYLRVPAAGMYTFNLISACGAKLVLDDKTIIDAGRYHSIANTPGAVALDAGLHKLSISYFQGAKQYQQADDFLQLAWSGPDLAHQTIPFSAYFREDNFGAGEPAVAIHVTQTDESAIRFSLTAETPADSVPDRIEYYATNPDFDYYSAQGAHGAEYFLGHAKSAAEPVPAILWGGGGQLVRARMVYRGNRTIDSAPFAIPEIPVAERHGPFQLTQLEHHLYPMACAADADSVTLVGESMGLLTKPVSGDCIIVAHLAGITSDEKQADGTTLTDANNWYAGVILRDNLNARPGEPLGGSAIPYAAVMGSASRQTRYCDSTMINGAGNQPASAGNGDTWFKIERKGSDFTLSTSPDGSTWKSIKTVNLPKMSASLHAGFVIYAIPSATNRVHWARFDHISISAGN